MSLDDWSFKKKFNFKIIKTNQIYFNKFYFLSKI